MGEKVEWKFPAIVGLIFVSITFTDLSPEGPWNDSTFTSGTIGLAGLCMLYISWFRFTFNKKGLIPTIDLWKEPEKSSKSVAITGLLILGSGYFVGRISVFPEPAGLILTLIGLLVLTNGAYVWLSTEGPLAEDNSESE